MIDDDTLLTINELFGGSNPTEKDLEIRPYDAVYSVATYYPGMVRLFVPNSPRLILRPELESYGDQKKRSKNIYKQICEEDLERSIRQSRKTLREILLSNRFDWFVTLTIGEDRYDSEKSLNKVLHWLKNQRKRNGLFKYVIVTEKHDDGARHFHGVFGNYKGRMKKAASPKSGRLVKKRGKQVYNLVGYRSGFSTAVQINNTVDDYQKVSNYLAKYINKQVVAAFGKKRYWCSQGLNRPIKERNPSWYDPSPTAINPKPDRVYEMEYGKILTYYKPEEKEFPAYVKQLLTDENK